MAHAIGDAQDKSWAYRCLLGTGAKEGKKGPGHFAGLSIADVVLRKKGRLHWVYTTKRGKIVTRRKFDWNDLMQAFFRLSKDEASNQRHKVKICRVTWQDQSTTDVDVEALAALVQQNGSCRGKKVEFLQPICHPSNVVDVAYADSSGIEIIKQADARPGSARLIKRVSWEVVKRIEEISGTKVASMVLGFVEEGAGRAMLVDVSQIYTGSKQIRNKGQFLPEISQAEKDSTKDRSRLRCSGDFCGYHVDESPSYNILLLNSPETDKTASIHATIPKSALLLARAEMGYITGAVRQLESSLRDDCEFAASWQKLDSKLAVDLRKKSGETEWSSEVPVCANCDAVYSKIELLRSSQFKSETTSKTSTPRIEPAEHEFFSRQIAQLEDQNEELLRQVETGKSKVKELELKLDSSESCLEEKLKQQKDKHSLEEKSWVEAMKEKDEECERLLLEVEALKHSLLSTSTSKDTQDAIAYARRLEDSKSSLLQRLRELNQRLARVESEKLHLESRLNEKLSCEAEAEQFSTLLDQERKASKDQAEKISSLERQLRDEVRAKGRVEAERDDLIGLKKQRELDINELRKSQAELRIHVAKLSSASTESKDNAKSKQDAKLMQALNELDFVRSQLASEVSCKEELSKTIAEASTEIAKAKAAAGRTEQALRQKYEGELKDANARLEKKVQTAQNEAKIGEEKLRQMQRNLHELTQDLGTARRKIETLTQDQKRLESLRQKLESDNRALLQNMEELQQSMIASQHGENFEEQPVTTLRSQKAQAEADLRKVESEVRYWKNQVEIETQLRKDAEVEALNVQQRLETATDRQLQEKERLMQQLEASEATQRKTLAEMASRLKTEVAEREGALDQNHMLETKLATVQEALHKSETEERAKRDQLIAVKREARAVEQELEIIRASKAKEHEVNRAAMEALEQTVHELERDQEQQKRISSEKLVQVHSSMKESTRKLLAVTEELKESEKRRCNDRALLVAMACLSRANASVKARALCKWRNTIQKLRIVESLKSKAAEQVEDVVLERQRREKHLEEALTAKHKEQLNELEERGKMVNEDLYKEYCQAYEELSLKLKEEHAAHVRAISEQHGNDQEALRAQHTRDVQDFDKQREALEMKLSCLSKQSAKAVQERDTQVSLLQAQIEEKNATIEQLSNSLEDLSNTKKSITESLKAEQRTSLELEKRLKEEKTSRTKADSDAEKVKQQTLDDHKERIDQMIERAAEEKEATIDELTKSFESKLAEMKEKETSTIESIKAKHVERVRQMGRANQACIDSLVKEHQDVVKSLEAQMQAVIEREATTQDEWQSKLSQAEYEQARALEQLKQELVSVREETKKEQENLVRKLEIDKHEALRTKAEQLEEEHTNNMNAAKKKWQGEAAERLGELQRKAEEDQINALKKATMHWQQVVQESKHENERNLEVVNKKHCEELATALEQLKRTLSNESKAQVRQLNDEEKKHIEQLREAHAEELAATKASMEKEKQERVEAALRDLQNTHDRILSINEAQHQATVQQLRESSEAEKQSAVAACAKEAAGQMLAELKRIKAEESAKLEQVKKQFEAREQKLLEECDAISEQRLQEAERAMEQSVSACRVRFQTRLDAAQREKDEALSKASNAVKSIDKANKVLTRSLELSQRKERIMGVYIFLLRMRAIRAACTIRRNLLAKGKREITALRREIREWVNNGHRPSANELRAKIDSIRNQLEATREEKRAAMKQERNATTELRKVEEEVGRVETQLREISMRSVIRRNGQVNEALARQKRSLDAALERSLQTVTQLREKRDRITTELRRLRDRSKEQETACEDVAKQLFEILLKRQAGIVNRLLPQK